MKTKEKESVVFNIPPGNSSISYCEVLSYRYITNTSGEIIRKYELCYL